MTENSVDDLHYGHCGEIIYNKTTQLWKSKRDTTVTTQLKRVGFPLRYATASIPSVSTSMHKHAAKYTKNRISTLNFVASHPEVAPAASLLYDLVLGEEEPLDPFHDDEYCIGELIAVGRARTVDAPGGGSRKTLHDVLAVPGGETGSSVRLLEMRSARQGWEWEHDHNTWLDTFEITESEAAVWESESGHVRQICFAPRVEDDTTLLAIRTATSITILRPLYQNVPLVKALSSHGSISISRILPNPLITLKMPPLGDAECVDVSFNPWYQRQVAAVNSLGCFVIWTFQGKQLLEAETLGAKMSEQFLENEEDRDTFHHYDGWHKISWIGNSNVLVVCNRRRLEAFELRGQTVIATGIDILAVHSPLWVLDMRKNPIRDDDLFITTTTHILWLRFHRVHASRKSSEFAGSFKTIFSWKHDRDVLDTSLQLRFRPTAMGFSTILFSRKTPLITELRYNFAYSDMLPSISAQGPFEMRHIDGFSIAELGNETGQSWVDLIVVPTDFGGRPFQSNQDALGFQFKKDGYAFFNVVRLSPHLALVGQMILSLENSGNDRRKEQHIAVTAPTWKTLRKRYAPRRHDTVPNEFVIQDEDATYSGLDEVSVRRNVFSSRSYSFGSKTLMRYEDDWAAWSVPNESIYEKICYLDPVRGPIMDVELAKIYEQLIDRAVQKPTLQTMHSALPGTLPARLDLEHVRTGIEASLTTQAEFHRPGTRLSVAKLASENVMGLGGWRSGHDSNGDITVSALVENLKNVYLKTLSKKTPKAVHRKVEHLTEQTAYNLFWASIGLSRDLHAAAEAILTNELPVEHTIEQTEGMSSSIVSSRRALPQSSQLQSSQFHSPYLPTSPATPFLAPKTPSFTISHLSAYTSISNPPSAFSEPLNNILSHWNTSVDPETYNWEATSALVAGTVGGNISGSAMSNADRERQQKKLERQMEREREKDSRIAKRRRFDLGNEFSESQGLSQFSTGWINSQQDQDETQNQAPEQFRRRPVTSLPTSAESQPTLPTRLRSSPGIVDLQQSSQSQPQSQQQLQMASQAEPGRFGGRPNTGLDKSNIGLYGRSQIAVRDRRGQGNRKAGF